MSIATSNLSASKILATTAYLLVVGGIALVLALTGHAELMVVWFGIAGVGGVGGAVKTQLGEVARTVGTQHLENGASIAQLVEQTKKLELYTHDRMHELANGVTAIKGALMIAGIPVAGMPAPDPSSASAATRSGELEDGTP